MAHGAELKHFLSNCKSLPDVICVQETFLKENKVFNLDCYEVVRRDRVGTAGGGVATFIKSSINYKVLNNPAGIECIVIEIKCNGVKYVIVNVYNPPDVEMDKAVCTDLFKFKNAAIIGDFNAKSSLWKSRETNKRGVILEELIDEFNFVVLNTGQPTYQIRWGGMSVLDLSIVSSNIAMKSEWRVNNDSLGSDHLPCITEICDVIKSDTATAPKWLLNKADWSGFKECCVRTIDQDVISDDIEVS